MSRLYRGNASAPAFARCESGGPNRTGTKIDKMLKSARLED